MNSLFTQIAAMVFGTIILAILGFGGGNQRVIIQSRKYSSRKWKIFIIVGIIMVIGGLSMFMKNFPLNGFSNTNTGVGFSLAFIGILIFFLGKFGRWWNRD